MQLRISSILIALVLTTPALATTPLEREVETVARNFRIKTYETYRTNRAEYDRRMEAAQEAMRRFRFAKDDQDRIVIRDWFTASNESFTVEIPEIEMVTDRERLDRLVTTNSRRRSPGKSGDKGKGKRDVKQVNGFVKTDYQSNPRFKNRFPNLPSDSDNAGTAATGNDDPNESGDKSSGISNIFQSFGKSFLRGKGDDADQDESATPSDPDEMVVKAEDEDNFVANDDSSNNAATNQFNEGTSSLADDNENADNDNGDAIADTETEVVQDDATPDEGMEGDAFEQLNDRIFEHNLGVGLVVEDFRAEENKSLEFLEEFVSKLEALDENHTLLVEQRNVFGTGEQAEFTKLTSLEEVATEMMTAVNELSFGVSDDTSAEQDELISKLRMRISTILASHTT